MSDHTSILDKNLTLVLNAAWQPIGQVSPKKAIISMCSESGDQKAAMGMDLSVSFDDEGLAIFEYAPTPTTWDDWIQLPIRPGDLVVHSAHREIRVPTVIICGYTKMPMKRPKVSQTAIFERDGGVCQYSGENVGRLGGNLDHVVPLDQGGRSTFENLVWSKRGINFAKANRTPREAGLTLKRQPRAPATLPVSATITKANHDTWKPFMIRVAH